MRSSSADVPPLVGWRSSSADVADKFTTSISRNSRKPVLSESYPDGNWCTVSRRTSSLLKSALAPAHEMFAESRMRSSLNRCGARRNAGAYAFSSQPDHRLPRSCRPLLPWYRFRPFGNASAVLNSQVSTITPSKCAHPSSFLAVLARPCAAHDGAARPCTT
jgi:hypothetical protein